MSLQRVDVSDMAAVSLSTRCDTAKLGGQDQGVCRLVMVVARGRTAEPIKCMDDAEDALPRCPMDQQSYGGTAHYDTLRRIVKEEAGCNQTAGGTSHAEKIAVLCADSEHVCKVSLLGESPVWGTSLGSGLLSLELRCNLG